MDVYMQSTTYHGQFLSTSAQTLDDGWFLSDSKAHIGFHLANRDIVDTGNLKPTAAIIARRRQVMSVAMWTGPYEQILMARHVLHLAS